MYTFGAERLGGRVMFEGKPIIGIAGGIASGKSFIASLFAELGCVVISSDELVRQAYRDESVKHQLKQWWGKMVFEPNGEIDRSAVARKIFNYPSEKKRLEKLLHPIVAQTRERIMRQAAEDSAVKAFVWDTPLLFETGLNTRCDAVIFVDAPLEVRSSRAAENRGWDRETLLQRENLQLPLDKKRRLADYVVANTADADHARDQVREVLSRILDGSVSRPAAGSAGEARPGA
jgi:dephospho-CoA kinase